MLLNGTGQRDNYLSTNMIVINNIIKVFQAEDVETVALKNVSFEVEKGDFVTIMGPSGPQRFDLRTFRETSILFAQRTGWGR